MDLKGARMAEVTSLSAFAARKTVANVVSTTISSPKISPQYSDAAYDGQLGERFDEANSRPQKRRRTLETTRSLNTEDSMRYGQGQSQRKAVTIATEKSESLADTFTTSLEPGFAGDSKQLKILAENTVSSDSKGLDSSATVFHQLCTFAPSQKNVVTETETDWTVVLGGEDSIALVGHFDLWIRKGAVSIYGAVLRASSSIHRVYAPSTHALPVITAVVNPYGPYGQSAEISILSTKSRIRLLRDISPEFGKIWNKPIEGVTSRSDVAKRSFALIQNSAGDPYRRTLSALTLLTDSQSLIRELLTRDPGKEQTAILACGPKRSGKSTFCRILINAIVTKPISESQSRLLGSSEKPSVALLDVDPGQPEYGLPGQVSLVELASCILGPPFTHPEILSSKGNRVIQRQFFGSLSPKDDPDHYLDCVLQLYDSYRILQQSRYNLPLVINCAGWIQGAGQELLVQLIQRINISDAVYMSDGSGSEDLTRALRKTCSQKATRLHRLCSCPSQAIAPIAAELRTMQTLSYFHLTEPEADELRWNYKSMQEVTPIITYYSGPKQSILAVMILGDEQNPKLLEKILDGCIVDIVVIHNNAALPDTDDLLIEGNLQESQNREEIPEHLYHPSIVRSPTLIPYVPARNGLVRPLPPKYTQSLGQALIRSIDTQKHQFHLLMPVDFVLPRIREHMKQKLVLVRGKLDTPSWAYKEPLELDKARRRRREINIGFKEVVDEGRVRHFAENHPWASIITGHRGAGAKKRSGRRDLKYRSQAEGE